MQINYGKLGSTAFIILNISFISTFKDSMSQFLSSYLTQELTVTKYQTYDELNSDLRCESELSEEEMTESHHQGGHGCSRLDPGRSSSLTISSLSQLQGNVGLNKEQYYVVLSTQF